MKNNILIIIFLFALFLSAMPSLAQQSANDNSDDSGLNEFYLGQKPPGTKAEMFAPKALTIEPHDSPVISWDETWIIIGTMGQGIKFYKLTNGILSLTTNPLDFDLPEVVNGMAVSPSENKIYFLEWKNGGEEFCYIEKEEDKWTAFKLLGDEVDSFEKTWQFTVAKNENLYFSSNKILVSVFDGDTYLKPAPLKLQDNSDLPGQSPYISPDESYIIYSINYNLFISYNLNNGKWTNPIDLGPNINSDQYDHCPKISPNGKYLFFTSRRNGSDWSVYWADAGFVEELQPKELK